jgi:iron(III) transport system ATP-binding protein
LSGGQQQRVALARALVIEPKILLLDEPLSNLDAKLREETRLEIKRLQIELGITTIYVTHDQAEAMSMSDRIMVMHGGVVQQIGTPEEVYHHPVNRFVASFIGESNLWEGVLEEICGEEVKIRVTPSLVLTALARNCSPKTTLTVGSKITVSIRPESVREALPEEQQQSNAVIGKVIISEFTGISVNYLLQVQALSLKAMFVNHKTQVQQRGDELYIYIPKESIYLLG